MKAHNYIILSIAVSITALICMHEYTYDIPLKPYSIWQYFFEIIYSGSAYTALFYFVMLGIYKLLAITIKYFIQFIYSYRQ
jgi:hypothetical protein